MMQLKPANQRGKSEYKGLLSHHSFSFANYFDPANKGHSVLRVINDDWVAPETGFPTHGHRDMEILSLVIEGQLEHQDTMGHKQIVSAGEAQLMSAGSGVQHSEFNSSSQHPLRFLQIWIRPQEKGTSPTYQQMKLVDNDALQLIASKDGQQGSMSLNQDARVFRYRQASEKESTISYQLDKGRTAYIHVYEGQLRIGDKIMSAGDGLIVEELQFELQSLSSDQNAVTQALLFDLPKQKITSH